MGVLLFKGVWVWGCYTNRRAKVYKSVGFESPLTPALSPLDKA
jgi:hypothetical protein